MWTWIVFKIQWCGADIVDILRMRCGHGLSSSKNCADGTNLLDAVRIWWQFQSPHSCLMYTHPCSVTEEATCIIYLISNQTNLSHKSWWQLSKSQFHCINDESAHTFSVPNTFNEIYKVFKNKCRHDFLLMKLQHHYTSQSCKKWNWLLSIQIFIISLYYMFLYEMFKSVSFCLYTNKGILVSDYW